MPRSLNLVVTSVAAQLMEATSATATRVRPSCASSMPTRSRNSFGCAPEGQSMIARPGGDEFVVVPDQPMPTAAVESVARPLRTMLYERLANDMLCRAGNQVALPVPGGAVEALLSVRRMPMPFLAYREALSSGAI